MADVTDDRAREAAEGVYEFVNARGGASGLWGSVPGIEKILRTAFAEALEDTARLDWIQSTRQEGYGFLVRRVCGSEDNMAQVEAQPAMFGFLDLRAAIDAARKGEVEDG